MYLRFKDLFTTLGTTARNGKQREAAYCTADAMLALQRLETLDEVLDQIQQRIEQVHHPVAKLTLLWLQDVIQAVRGDAQRTYDTAEYSYRAKNLHAQH
jgi:hypothetical protein